MNIKKLIKEIHDNAIEKGFYDCPECKGNGFNKLADMCDSEEIKNGCDKCPVCNGTGIDPNKNIGELLMLIVSELGEALEAHRCNKFAPSDISTFLEDDEGLGKDYIIYVFEKQIKDTFEDEIADVFIRLFDLCGYLAPDHTEKIRDDWHTEKKWTDNMGDNLRKISKMVLDVYPNYLTNAYFSSCLSYLNSFCTHYNIPIEKHIKAKMEFNRTRPHKHGKEY